MDLVFIRWHQGFVSLKSSKDCADKLQCQHLLQITKHHHQESPVTDSISRSICSDLLRPSTWYLSKILGLTWHTANGILYQLCLTVNHREEACRLQGHTELNYTYAFGRMLGMLGLENELLTPANKQCSQFFFVFERRPIVNFFMLKFRNKGTSSILNRLIF